MIQKLEKKKIKIVKIQKRTAGMWCLQKERKKKQDIFLNKSSKGALLTDGYTLRYKRKAGGGSDINTTNVFVCLKALFFLHIKKNGKNRKLKLEGKGYGSSG